MNSRVSRAANQSAFSRFAPFAPPSPAASGDTALSDEVSHWDHQSVGSRLRQYNPPHQLVRAWVPDALHPERVAAAMLPPPDVERFRVTEDDATRGALLVAATQATLGTFGVAMAIDGFWAGGPTFANPAGRVDPGLGCGAAVSAALGFTVLGAAVGNLWYNALLSASARSWPTLRRHHEVADTAAAAGGIACALGAWGGAITFATDFLRRSLAAPAEGPAPANAIYEYTTALTLMTTGPFLYGCTGWYVGRLLGAHVAEALTPARPLYLDDDSDTEQSPSGTADNRSIA